MIFCYASYLKELDLAKITGEQVFSALSRADYPAVGNSTPREFAQEAEISVGAE